jgi:quinolinate synthase
MEKNSLSHIVQDLKSKRDALLLAHEQLKKDNNDWNKCIIILSLITGMFESMKIQMGWQSDVGALVPIALSSVIASVSALIKFKKFHEQMEVILQSHMLLTHTLNNARNEKEMSPQLHNEYNDALEKLEIIIYPDIHRKYLKISHNNLISIVKQEVKFFTRAPRGRN